MSPERRTVAGWVHHLEAPDAQLTLTEFMALCLVHIRESAMNTTHGTQHLEGMLGTLDETLATTHPVYSALAAKRAATTPELGGYAPPGPNGVRP